jgi:hypothetical protein
MFFIFGKNSSFIDKEKGFEPWNFYFSNVNATILLLIL